MSAKCYESIFIKFDFSQVDCFKMMISKTLSYGIIAGSLLLKVPQILKILAAKSGKGISIMSELMMIVALFGSMSYGYTKQFPLSSYGDVYFLYIQSIIILMLVLAFEGSYLIALLSLTTIGGASFLLFTNAIPIDIILTLNAANIGLTCMSKLNQAFLNFRNGSTGALSAITLMLQFLGGVARIFTSIQETGDFNLILTYAITSVANFILVFQLFYYWNSDAKAAKKQAKQAKKTN